MAEDSSVEKQYVFGNAYLKYHNSEDETDNIVWYENENSVTDKINMAKLFGVNGISLWRLGTIPDYEDEGINLNIWNEILNAEGK
jgi:spore germination protein YaaH